ncbi:type VI immunity family protein [Cystobacter fuscus]
MSHPIPRIRIYSSQSGQERLVRREVVRLVLHLPFDHHDLALSVRQALDLYLSTIGQGPEVLSEWYDLETEPFPLDDDNWEIIRAVMAPPRGDRFLDDIENPQEAHRYIKNQFERAVELSGGTAGVSGYGFFYRARLPWRDPGNTVSLVSFSWPAEYLEERGPKRMRELLLDLAALLPFSSGHAGLAFSSTHFSTLSFGQIREEAFRHPGIDVTHGNTSLGRRIDGVHWINLLGQSLLDEVGGLGGLQDRLHFPDTHVQEMEGGRAVVTLGQWPKAGDTSRGDSLPDHRELARALEPWLSTCPESYALVGASPSETQSWWRRFLDS